MSTKARPADIDGYLRGKEPHLIEVANGLRRLVKKIVPKSDDVINPWGVPVFGYHGPLCFMMVGKHHVTFGFARATSLPDPNKLLEGTGKHGRHVKLRDMEGVKTPGLRDLIDAAAKLNRDSPPDTVKKARPRTGKQMRSRIASARE
jgi:hypothetical protein